MTEDREIWEYCRFGMGSLKTFGLDIEFFTKEGVKKTHLTVNNWAMGFAELGDEGWDLVGVVGTGEAHWLYFKRKVN